MTLQVTTHHSPSPDVTVLALSGTPAEDLLALVADAIAELTTTGQTVVVDLDEFMMTRASTMRAFLARLLAKSYEERLVLKCGRLTGRRVLRRWTTDDLLIVSRVSDGARPETEPGFVLA